MKSVEVQNVEVQETEAQEIETSDEPLEQESTHYPETSAIEKAPAALETQLETQTEAANEQSPTKVENASAAE